jgi:hypothetical protein
LCVDIDGGAIAVTDENEDEERDEATDALGC